MLTANYMTDGPLQNEAEIKQAINYALATWGAVIPQSATFNIKLAINTTMNYLATCGDHNPISTGKESGKNVYIPSAQAKLQGLARSSYDFLITWNTNYPWHWGSGTSSGKYTAYRTALHEVGHALFATTIAEMLESPWDIWSSNQPNGTVTDNKMHLSDPNSIMYPSSKTGLPPILTQADIDIASGCSLPTNRNSRIYLMNGATLNGGPATMNVAIWLYKLAAYNASLTNFEYLELRGDSPLTEYESQVYRIYKAAFARFPDLAGLQYWVSTAKPIDQIATIFTTTPEFISKFGSNPTHSSYITQLYYNILNRAPDTAGYNYWMTRTDMTRAQLLTAFAFSAENVIGIPTFKL